MGEIPLSDRFLPLIVTEGKSGIICKLYRTPGTSHGAVGGLERPDPYERRYFCRSRILLAMLEMRWKKSDSVISVSSLSSFFSLISIRKRCTSRLA